MGLDYSNTWTCYNGREKACGKCDGHNDPDAKFCKHCGQGFAA